MALSWLLRVGLWRKAVVLRAVVLRGDMQNSRGFGSLLISSVALCKECLVTANGMVLKVL